MAVRHGHRLIWTLDGIDSSDVPPKDFVQEASLRHSLTTLRTARHRPFGWTQTTVSRTHRPRLGWTGIPDANRRKRKPPSDHQHTLAPCGDSATSPLGQRIS